MMELYSFMWACAIFFMILGFMRGLTKELVGMAGIVLGIFALFQFDALFRSTIFLLMEPAQVFWLQALSFIVFVFIVYNAREFGANQRRQGYDFQESLLGGIVGFINGYLFGGTLWYFLDINEYPIPEVLAPALGSPSAQGLTAMPLVLIGGGASGTGDLLAVLVVLLLLLVLFIA